MDTEKNERRKFTSKKWLIAFAGSILLIALLWAAFNAVTDPFGVFGDRFFTWWSYDETLNPRAAKIGYLEQNHDKYDSYIIGASTTSSYPAEDLNKYYGANFYNMIMYGADLYDIEKTADYVIDNYEVKNLVLSLIVECAETYNLETDPLTYGLHYKVDGSSPLKFYSRYLFANPSYGADKLKRYFTHGYLQDASNVFDEASGAYDKSRRDAEDIGALSDYTAREEYSIFLDYPKGQGGTPYLKECMDSVARIKSRCEEKGISFTMLCAPMYYEHLNYFAPETVKNFNVSLAKVTDYWDFTLSSLSYDPRFFYDKAHFRNCAGKMALAKIFGDESVYVPEDFGFHATSENTDELFEHYKDVAAKGDVSDTYQKNVPILMYHSVCDDPSKEGAAVISAGRLEEHFACLRRAGYTPVSLKALCDYVEKGTELPDKPVALTFDDGYEDNLKLAYPVLKKYGAPATVFVIGVSEGKDTYKDTGESMNPHFSLKDVRGFEDLLSFQSHGFNVHEVEGRDIDPIRKGVLQKDGEPEEQYTEFLKEDAEKMKTLFSEAGLDVPTVFSYPFGYHSRLSEVILREEGISCTLTSDGHTNVLIKGQPQSLLDMGRFSIPGDMSGSDLIKLIESE